jgi:HPt (histidine-containing phosphotransfer) domain-containing protein
MNPLPSQILDAEALERLADLESTRPGFFIEILMEFENDIESSLSRLTTAMRSSNAELVWQTAHHIKGSCGVVGTARMKTVCDWLEEQGRSGSLDSTQSAIDTLRREYEKARAALDKERARFHETSH